jgi:hypothetical protein
VTRRVQTRLAPEVLARIDALLPVPRGPRTTKAKRRARTFVLLILRGLEEEEARLGIGSAAARTRPRRGGGGA